LPSSSGWRRAAAFGLAAVGRIGSVSSASICSNPVEKARLFS
jgi:hypothetical protein